MEYTNGIMEDLGAVIGTSAAVRLIAIFGGTSLYVPATIDAEHPIARVIGLTPAIRLVEAFGSETLSNLPRNEEFYRLRRISDVAALLRAGIGADRVASILNIGARQVRKDRVEAESMGLIPMVFDHAAPSD